MVEVEVVVGNAFTEATRRGAQWFSIYEAAEIVLAGDRTLDDDTFTLALSYVRKRAKEFIAEEFTYMMERAPLKHGHPLDD